jgi:hypothetical protein
MGKEEVSDGIPGQHLSDASGANAGSADPVAFSPPWSWIVEDGEYRALRNRHPDGGGTYILTPEATSDGERSPVETWLDVSHAHARLIAAAPVMADYISERAEAGCPDAAAIMEQIHGR